MQHRIEHKPINYMNKANQLWNINQMKQEHTDLEM